MVLPRMLQAQQNKCPDRMNEVPEVLLRQTSRNTKKYQESLLEGYVPREQNVLEPNLEAEAKINLVAEKEVKW